MDDDKNPEAKGKAPSYVEPVDGLYYIWYVTNLYPAKNSMIGVYDHPPPPGSEGVHALRLDSFGGWDSVVQRQVILGLRGLTRAKDYIHNLLH